MSETNNNREVAIRLSGIKKRYVLGQIGGKTLQADLQSWWARKRGKEDPNTKIDQDQRLVGKSFMALNGIDLTIYKGEAVGIIGHNGAGKSTMLKLLSRVTAPSEGEIDLYGRVASMLEVGTGFNGEMTGRENIYMNGAILGMTKAEIDAKMEQIIDFSEVRDFIDTPVKRYSSGMYVKLAFSVAAHLDNEIMIMDEVLAVGDMAFQKKCLDKMREAATKEGRTVLYVSHNMNTIRQLCERCIVLDQGKVVFDGEVEEAIHTYLGAVITNDQTRFYSEKDHETWTRKKVVINSSSIKNELSSIYSGDPLEIILKYKTKEKIQNAFIRLVLLNADDQVLGMSMSDKPIEFSDDKKDQITIRFDTSALSAGRYKMRFSAFHINEFGSHEYLCVINNFCSFDIQDDPKKHHGMVWSNKSWGFFALPDLTLSNME